MNPPVKATKPISPWLVFGYCLLVSAGCLLLCSKSSFLYPINDWSDTNIFFTMGKGMANGRMIYRDLYDHKGPLLYALYALCYLLSPMSFWGVWLMEVLCLALFLQSIYQLFRLYGVDRPALWALPVLAFLLTSSDSFQQGGSAEELCLPLLSWSLVLLLRYLKTGYPNRMPSKALLIGGILCGCVLWMKYTMLGFHLGWILTVFLSQARQKHWKDAWISVLWFAAGIALTALPWLLYFGLHGAIGDWLKTYFYDNLILYSASGEATGIFALAKAMVSAGLSWFGLNLGYTLLTLLGLGFISLRKAGAPYEKTAIWLTLGFCALGVFSGGKEYRYYGYILSVFAAFGLVPVCLWLCKHAHRLFETRRLWTALAAALCAGCFALCYAVSPNTKTSFLLPREETMQYQMAAHINGQPGATLLNYGFMDAGFYTATGIVPNVKYFHQTNVPLQEMLDEQVRYIEDGLCTFVITRGKQPQSITGNYDLIATADSPGFWYEHVYLYRLREGEP